MKIRKRYKHSDIQKMLRDKKRSSQPYSYLHPQISPSGYAFTEDDDPNAIVSDAQRRYINNGWMKQRKNSEKAELIRDTHSLMSLEGALTPDILESLYPSLQFGDPNTKNRGQYFRNEKVEKVKEAIPEQPVVNQGTQTFSDKPVAADYTDPLANSAVVDTKPPAPPLELKPARTEAPPLPPSARVSDIQKKMPIVGQLPIKPQELKNEQLQDQGYPEDIANIITKQAKTPSPKNVVEKMKGKTEKIKKVYAVPAGETKAPPNTPKKKKTRRTKNKIMKEKFEEHNIPYKKTWNLKRLNKEWDKELKKRQDK